MRLVNSQRGSSKCGGVGVEGSISASAMWVWNLTASAPASAAASISRSACRIEPSWLLPISAMTSAGCPGPSSLPAISTAIHSYDRQPGLAWILVEAPRNRRHGRPRAEAARRISSTQPEWDVVGVADRSSVAYARLQAELYDRPRPHGAGAPPTCSRWSPRRSRRDDRRRPLAGRPDARRRRLRGRALRREAAGRQRRARPRARAAARRTAACAVGFQRRGSAMYAEAARTLHSGELGAVRSLRWGPPIPSQISMKGAHHFDLANWLAGEPTGRRLRPARRSTRRSTAAAPTTSTRRAGRRRVRAAARASRSTRPASRPDGLDRRVRARPAVVGPEEDALVVSGPGRQADGRARTAAARSRSTGSTGRSAPRSRASRAVHARRGARRARGRRRRLPRRRARRAGRRCRSRAPTPRSES